MAGIDDPTTLEYCLLELILNSLKAEATAIAVRIDFRNQEIQVIDNGFGFSKNALRRVGRYSAKHGSLVRIEEISSLLVVTSRSQYATKTYGRCFSSNEEPVVRRVKDRPTRGTTVTVSASKKFCNWKEDDSFAIKFIIVCLSLTNTQVSFSVRDDTRGSILLRIGKFQKWHRLLRVILERPVRSAEIGRIKTRVGKVKISGFWGGTCKKLRKIQQVLLNLKPVHCPSLEKAMLSIFAKNCYPCAKNHDLCWQKIFFLVYIVCPDSEYNLYVKDTKLIVDFHQIDEIVDSIEKFFRKRGSNKNKPSKTSIYKSIVPEKISRPSGGILGVKQNRSFFTKVTSHKFQKTLTATLTKRRIKDLPEIENVTRFSRRTFTDVNHDIAGPDLENINSEDPVPTGEQGNKRSRANERIVEELKSDKSLSSIPSPIKDNDKTSKTDVKEEPSILNSSQSSFEKPQEDKSKSPKRFGNFFLKEQDCDDYDSTESRSRMEKSGDDIELATVSQYWPSDYAKAVEVNNKSQRSIMEEQQCVDTSSEKEERERVDESLPIVKEYQYDNHGVLWISQKCNEKISNGKEEMYDIGFSQWSDWSYELNTSVRNDENSLEAQPIFSKRFRFLPLQLHALLPFLNEKLIYRNPSEDVRDVPLNMNLNYRRQDLDVRACTRRPLEFRLEMESLKSMKVLKQVNREFIVALTKQNEKKLVVIVDQHAMHERIRYENLLRAYKRDQKNQQFISVVLHRPIIISDLSSSSCSILSSHQSLLIGYGLNLAFRNEATLLIFAVPRCFMNKTFRADYTEVEVAVRKLLQEVLDNINKNGGTKLLPFTIHDAIASEACHGAIKFGDFLTRKQCKSLIACWTETEAPNRCAHGRPSVVPLLEVPSHPRNNYEILCERHAIHSDSYI